MNAIKLLVVVVSAFL